MPISDQRPGRGPRSLAGRIPVLIAAVGLAACAVSIPAADRADVRVAGSRVTVVAPPGFCVDPQSVDVTRAGGFILFGDCAVLNASAPTGAPLGAVVTASVANAGLPGTLEELEAFLTRSPARVTLGKSGEADKISVLGSSRRDGVLYVKVEDLGTQPVPGASPRFWRAMFEAGDRLVIGSITGFSPADLSDSVAQANLKALADATRAANRPPAATAPAPPVPPA